MRVMTPEEMETAIQRCNWATICTADPEGTPYAIEATPFRMDACHCFMINPRGGTWKNLRSNPRVLLKYTLTNKDLSLWAGISCHGKGEFLMNEEALLQGWRLLAEVMGTDYSQAAATFCRCTDRSPLFRVRVESMTGRCSAGKDMPLILPGNRLCAPNSGAEHNS